MRWLLTAETVGLQEVMMTGNAMILIRTEVFQNLESPGLLSLLS